MLKRFISTLTVALVAVLAPAALRAQTGGLTHGSVRPGYDRVTLGGPFGAQRHPVIAGTYAPVGEPARLGAQRRGSEHCDERHGERGDETLQHGVLQETR